MVAVAGGRKGREWEGRGENGRKGERMGGKGREWEERVENGRGG